MPTTTINSVSDLTAWVAGIPADMGGAAYRGEMNNTGIYTLTSTLVFNGKTNGSIVLTAVAGQGFSDNTQAATNALRFNQSNGVALTSTSTPVIDIDNINVTLSNLQIQNTTGNGAALLLENASTIDDCIITASGLNAPLQIHASGNKVRNSLIYTTGSTNTNRVVFISNSGGCSFYFCDIVASTDSGPPAFVTDGDASGSATFENCSLFGCTDIDNGASSGTFTYTTCMTDVVSPPSGVTGGKTYASQFYALVAATGDWREKAGANLQGAGTADATNGATDIRGLARPQAGKWDIGAWQIAAAGDKRWIGWP